MLLFFKMNIAIFCNNNVKDILCTFSAGESSDSYAGAYAGIYVYKYAELNINGI